MECMLLFGREQKETFPRNSSLSVAESGQNGLVSMMGFHKVDGAHEYLFKSVIHPSSSIVLSLLSFGIVQFLGMGRDAVCSVSHALSLCEFLYDPCRRRVRHHSVSDTPSRTPPAADAER